MGNYVWPCPDYTGVSSPFGWRGSDMHEGVDLGCSRGKPILATKDGTVIFAGKGTNFNASYGNYVQINHGSGITSLYAHCDSVLVRTNQKVTAGQQIAKVGSTGNSTGPHLHFEIKINGQKKNPLNYVSDKDTLLLYSVAKGISAGAAIAAAAVGKDSGKTTVFSGNDAQSDTGTSGVLEEEKKSKEITSIIVKSTIGTAGTYKYTALRSQDAVLSRGCEIMIQENLNKIHIPVVEGEITLQYERKGAPGTLTFNVVKEGALSFFEGNPVSLRVDGTRIFYGYVFKKKRDKSGVITVTCYDQLRYLKNKDTLVYENKKYSELLQTIAGAYNLKTGTVEDTGHVIAGAIEEGTLFDILANAADETVLSTGRLYVLYDDCGSICLKNIQNMQVPVLIDRDTAQDFDYTSGIDDQTYNRIKLARDNSDTGERELYVANSTGTQSSWGILQYYENAGSVGSSAAGAAGTETGGSSDGMGTQARTISQTGIALIKEFEGCDLTACDDGAGTVTIGYGHTGVDVYWGQRITQAQAEAYLSADLQYFEKVVNRLITVPITQNMFDALVSFSFNVGENALAESTLRQKLNQGDYAGAANEFERWNQGGGQVMPGLVRRREAERKLFLLGYTGGGISRSTQNPSGAASDSVLLKEKADVLLKYYNKKTRSLQIKDCFGDVRVRGGSTVVVNMDIGDIQVSNYMVVESVKHRFAHGMHTMDLKVVGIRGEFIA